MTSPLCVGVLAAEPRGGHPEYVSKLLTGLVSADTTVTVRWPVRPDLEKRFRSDCLGQTTCMPVMRSRAELGRLRWLGSRLLFWKRHDFAFLLWSYRERHSLDCVLIEEVQRFTLLIVVASLKILGLRVVVHLHNVRRHDYSGSFVDRIDEHLLGIALRISDLTLVHSDSNRREVYGLLSAQARVEVLPHGIAPVVAEVVDPPSSPRFLLFGVMRRNKGVEVLAEASKELPKGFSVMMAGVADGDFKTECRRLVDLGDGRVSWMDAFVEDSEVQALLSQITALVLPYTAFSAQSGVLHLAIEYGVPVVASDVGALGETIRDLDLGIVVPPANATALAEAMIVVADLNSNRVFRYNCIKAQSGRTWADCGLQLNSKILQLCAG